MQINIEKIVTDKIKEMEAAGTVEKAIADNIEKAILKAITDSINDYKIERTLKDAVCAEVSENMKKLDFTSYNGFIANTVKNIIEGSLQKDIKEKIEKRFNEILIVKHDGIKLSDIIDKYRDFICRHTDESEKYDLQHFYVSVEEHEEYHWITVKLGESKKRFDRYSSNSIEFTVHRERMNKEATTGTMGCVYIEGKDLKKSVDLGYINEIEALILNLAYNDAPILIDITDSDDIDDHYDTDY